MAKILLLILITTLLGCNNAKERQGLRIERLAGTCESYGFVRGTNEFSECMMTLDQQRKAQRSASSAALLEAGTKILEGNVPRPAPGSQNTSINCTSTTQGVYTNTKCR